MRPFYFEGTKWKVKVEYRILYVDGNTKTQNLLSTLLEEVGCEVTAVEDPFLRTAIQDHRGEATIVIQTLTRFSASDQSDLPAFTESL